MTRERLTASEKAAAREAELDEQIWRERVTQAALEQAVADADAALRPMRDNGTRQHWPERRRSSPNARLISIANCLETAADRARLTQQLSEAEVALDQARRDHQSSTAQD